MYQETTATKKIKNLTSRIRAISGGTSASKTISILLYLIAKAQTDTKPTLTSIVSESFPHLKRGVMRDFLLILQEHNYYDDNRWNRSDYTYTFETGSKIEFFSADQPSKVRGPRRDRLFINEANNIPYEAFDQLEIRTKDFVFLDWNPTNEFWFYDELEGRDDVEFIILTYKDNEALDKEIIKSIEQHRNNKQWWRVYGEGRLGEVEGKIYKGWKIIDDIPDSARLEKRGLDFGYSNDPTGIVDVYKYNNAYVLDELLYKTGMKNKQIADVLNAQEDTSIMTVADSAEPKSIDEIKDYGVNIVGAIKGPGSVSKGIDYVQSQQILITKRSINLIKAYRNYMWKIDKEGKVLNEPDHFLSDLMDATRYALNSFSVKKRKKHTIARRRVRNPIIGI